MLTQENVHFKPVSLENISVIDAMESDIFLLDTNSDGAPELFQEYLGISAKELENSGSDSISYVRACLSVPDPENYTKEDIYNCISELLAEYAEK